MPCSAAATPRVVATAFLLLTPQLARSGCPGQYMCQCNWCPPDFAAAREAEYRAAQAAAQAAAEASSGCDCAQIHIQPCEHLFPTLTHEVGASAAWPHTSD